MLTAMFEHDSYQLSAISIENRKSSSYISIHLISVKRYPPFSSS